ncbi:beta-D-glucosyl crocetin beta-1,6-glucosyltransferase-like [Ziziphus jujuba]|uniref:Glycosyltransferase n=1 Tax=Ziziphus jujuba TaxID=326968 RepID=A0A6P3ZLY5_ZIZJJ|nr:beta-D-glucosyl crocetin beta-1,6-glucosyltransferase-like [Ziziphus jujuba]
MGDPNQLKNNIKVLIFPWLAHGHITPLLELAKKLTQRNFHIYFCSTPVNLDSIKPKIVSDPKFSNSIQLVELHLPSLPELPPHHHTTKGLPPHLLPTLHRALRMTEPNLANILDTLKPDFAIHDIFPGFVPDLTSSLNIPSFVFINTGANFISCLIHRGKKKQDHEYPYPQIFPDDMDTKISTMLEITSANYEAISQYYDRCGNIVLIKSFEELEGKYIDYLSALLGKKIVMTGILVPDPSSDDEEGMDIINWLDKKEKASTVFVSFGSECYLSKEDLEEVAHGLELSKVNFIWVIRFPEGEKLKLEDALPNGFLGKVKEKGLVVENWAPQMKILKHSSIGGFVSHCGWGSLTESIKFGVPVIATPIQYEQPWNARLIEECGIGLEVERNSKGGLPRENIAKIIKQVVIEKTGEDIRRKAKVMSDNVKRKGDREIDEVVKELLQIL